MFKTQNGKIVQWKQVDAKMLEQRTRSWCETFGIVMTLVIWTDFQCYKDDVAILKVNVMMLQRQSHDATTG